jgi:hypothetical protein
LKQDVLIVFLRRPVIAFFKSPKETAKLSKKRAETSVVLIVFDCVLYEVRAYKLISINAVTVSNRRST